VVYKVAAYGNGDEVRLMHGQTNAKCSKTSAITARLCACKKAAAIGESCSSSSGCAESYCEIAVPGSGACTKLLSQGDQCTEHDSCTTGYCSPTESTCSTLDWKTKQGAFALSYRKSGARRSKQIQVPNWEAMTKFPEGFCLGYYGKTTGCQIAVGIDRSKTIAKAKQRCAVSAECKAVWCCATACPATTCYATKAQAPNHKAKDCPDAPGSFHETKYPNSFYVKDEPTQGAAGHTPSQPNLPPTNAPTPDKVSNGGEEETTEQKIYKEVASKRTSCSFGNGVLKKLLDEDAVDDCAEAAKQRAGLGFGWIASKKECIISKKSWSECSDEVLSKLAMSDVSLYELEPGAGDEDQKQD